MTEPTPVPNLPGKPAAREAGPGPSSASTQSGPGVDPAAATGDSKPSSTPAQPGPGASPAAPTGDSKPSSTPAQSGPGFELYDLRVEVVGPPDQPIYCGARLGDYFELHGEMLQLPPGQGFSIYSLAALLPLLPAKQRATDPNDWMTSDAEVACPDPNCPTRFRITRTGRRYFKRSDVTAVPLPEKDTQK